MYHVLTVAYTQPLDLVDATRPAHIAWLEEQIDAGLLILTGRQESGKGARSLAAMP